MLSEQNQEEGDVPLAKLCGLCGVGRSSDQWELYQNKSSGCAAEPPTLSTESLPLLTRQSSRLLFTPQIQCCTLKSLKLQLYFKTLCRKKILHCLSMYYLYSKLLQLFLHLVSFPFIPHNVSLDVQSLSAGMISIKRVCM